MARTTVRQVETLLGKDYDTTASGNRDLTPYVQTASPIIDRLLAQPARPGIPMPTAEEAEILERWLAAHFYVQTDRQFTSKSAQGSSASYAGSYGMRLESSSYGLTAMLLDQTGYLTRINNRAVASISWAGTTPEEATPADQRGY